jgi:hypothetical protein
MFNPDEEKYMLACSGANHGCGRKWQCRDGRIVAIEEMDDSHLVNSLLRVQRHWPWRSEYYHCLVNEARKRSLI